VSGTLRSYDAQNLLQRAAAEMESMGRGQRKAAEFLVKRPYFVLGSSLEQYAEAADTSRHSILRMARTLGFTGFKELQHALSQMFQAHAGEISNPMLRWLFHSAVEAVVDTVNHMHGESFERAVSLCGGAKRIFFYGVGESGLLAEIMHHRCLLLGLDSTVCVPGFPNMGALFGSDKALIMISRSGQGTHLQDVMAVAQDTGTPVMAVSAEPNGWLAKTADLVLLVSAPALRSRSHLLGLKTGFELLLNAVVFEAAARRGVALQDDC